LPEKIFFPIFFCGGGGARGPLPPSHSQLSLSELARLATGNKWNIHG